MGVFDRIDSLQANLEIGYDPEGNRLSLTEAVTKIAVGFEYDSRDQLSALVTHNKQRLTLGDDAAQRKNHISFSNGVSGDYLYGTAGRLQQQKYGSVPSQTMDYSYTPRGNVSVINEGNSEKRYSYDAIQQLLSNESDDLLENYSHDPGYNRESSHIADDYQYNENNRLQSVGDFRYDYDSNGNLLRKEHISSGDVTAFKWDAQDQLIAVSKMGEEIEYRYDGMGRRIAKVVNGVSTYFVYDGRYILYQTSANNIGNADPAILGGTTKPREYKASS